MIMLFKDVKENALAIHRKATDNFKEAFDDFQKSAEALYVLRKESIVSMEKCENLINSIANTPKDLNTKLFKIETDIIEFRDTYDYAEEAEKCAIMGGAGVVAAIGGAGAFAVMAPDVALWLAKNLGVAGNGKAIIGLAGAAQKKAALAWLAGGPLAQGGGGVVGGEALLHLAGPIGWVFAVAGVGINAIKLGGSNKKIANQAIAGAKNITIAGAQLRMSGAEIEDLLQRTQLLRDLVEKQLDMLMSKKDCNYHDLPSDEQLQLGALVNNSLSLSEMLNKKVE